MYKAVVFDFDGTIIDTERHFFNTSNDFLTRHGATVMTEDMYRASVGGSGDGIAAYLRDALGEEGLTAIADTHRDTSCTLDIFPHIQAWMAYFKQHHIPMAIATSSYREDIMPAVKALGLDKDISVVIGREDVEAIKPEPDLYLTAVRELNYRPTDCLAIEDSASGAQAAVNAGMDVVVMTNGFTQGHDFSHIPYLEKDIDTQTFLERYFKA